MKPEDHDRIYVSATKSIMEYPKGLEQYMPVDEVAKSMVLLHDPDVSKNMEKYFLEQSAIKHQVKELYEELEKLFGEYQRNAARLIEYLKNINI